MVELVVAMMVLSVILVLLAAVQISAIATITEARKLQQATAFGNEAAEQMRSIPWNTLSKGMYSGFLAASGGDSLVSGNYLTIPGSPSELLQIAPAGVNDQKLTSPARPLFTATGSNKQTRTDPSLTGVEFAVKAYVTHPSGLKQDGIVGIIVVVEWPNNKGGVSRTTLRSQAYRGSITGCGSAETQPFLAACQSFFEASSGTGNVTVEISALNVPADPADLAVQPLMTPGDSDEYSLSMRSAGASASVRSQQVNYADANLQFGGNIWARNDVSSSASERGFAFLPLRATDDETNQNGWPIHEPAVTTTQGSIAENEWYVSDSDDSPISLRVRSDYARPGTQMASMTNSCLAGIPANQPCARGSLTNGAVLLSGSGYLLMDFTDTENNTTVFRLSRRLNEVAGSNAGNVEEAWAARFISAAGTAAVGCTAVTGAGCVSAGASRTMAEFSVGTVAVPAGVGWNGAAVRGMVVLKGDTACPGTVNDVNYGESVMVQRGSAAGQNTVAPTVERCGKLEYWTGTGTTGYSTQIVRKDTSASIQTVPVTWTSGDGVYTIVASTQVQIIPSYWVNVTATPPFDPACRTEACFASVAAGSIVMVSTYHISWPGHEHLLIAATTITGPSAQASYTAAPSGP